jgi:hypothetical protein
MHKPILMTLIVPTKCQTLALCCSLSLCVLLWGVGDGKTYKQSQSSSFGIRRSSSGAMSSFQGSLKKKKVGLRVGYNRINLGEHTRWQRLLQLLGLLGILQDKSVKVSLAADLELDLRRLLVLLYASSYLFISPRSQNPHSFSSLKPKSLRLLLYCKRTLNC